MTVYKQKTITTPVRSPQDEGHQLTDDTWKDQEIPLEATETRIESDWREEHRDPRADQGVRLRHIERMRRS